jgi:hypothetical protein
MEWNGNEEVAVVAGINFITWPQLGGSRKMGSDENTMATDAMKQTRAPFSKAAAFWQEVGGRLRERGEGRNERTTTFFLDRSQPVAFIIYVAFLGC